MPWSIEKRENRYCVIKDDDGTNEGCHDSEEQAEEHRQALYASEGESVEPSRLTLEAEIQPAKGKEWAVTIIGASGPDSVVEANGRTFIRSKNGRLYDVAALAESEPLWNGVRVYDNHLTQDEFERRQGMRSTLNEWIGVIVDPKWDAAANKLRARLKIVETRLADKLKNAWEAGVLGAVGLSIDTLTKAGQELLVEGKSLPVIEGFQQILSVDVVQNPAAGGAFDRIIAAHYEEHNMTDEAKTDNFVTVEMLDGLVAKVDALSTKLEAAQQDVDDMEDEEVQQALDGRKAAESQKQLIEIQKKRDEAKREMEVARTQLTLERELDKVRMPERFEDVVRSQFDGQIATKEEIRAAIKRVREAYASMDPTGRVRAGGQHDISVGLGDEDRFALEFQRLLMGNREFGELEHNKHDAVKERMAEHGAYNAWINAGKPDLPRYNRLSTLLFEYFGGDPLLSARAAEAASTSTLATVVKNTVNIMTAHDYSQREEWWAPIVTVEEVDTIDDATLARVYGVDTLSVVNEGAAYTEIALQDEEETASFVKRGNYIGVTLETLMRDKLNHIRTIPRRLADAWYNTQSDLVGGVFTVNSNTGPVLGTTGALFNATATSSAGGHANLLTTALSHAAYGAARTAMRKQTDQPSGNGRKLLLEPTHLLVPVDLETTALEILNSELQPEADGAGTTGNQTANIYRGQFQVIVVPGWTDATDWAIVSNQQPAIHLVYPRGQRTPQVFSADNEMGGAMFTNDELRFKVRLMTYRFSATYDCAPVSDFRPLHKNNVAG